MASASSLPRILSGEALLEMDAHSRLETDGVSSPNRRAYGSGSSLTGVPRRPSPLRERSSCTSEAASDAGSGWASDRGSVFSERVEKVAAVAAEAMVTPGFKMTLFGLACLLMPALVLLLAPLMVLLMPLLLPLGFTLLVLGLGRAAVGMSFAHRAAHRAPPRDARWRLGGGGARRPSELSEATGGTGLSPLIAQVRRDGCTVTA